MNFSALYMSNIASSSSWVSAGQGERVNSKEHRTSGRIPSSVGKPTSTGS